MSKTNLDNLDNYFTKTCPCCGTKNPLNQIFCTNCKRRFIETYG